MKDFFLTIGCLAVIVVVIAMAVFSVNSTQLFQNKINEVHAKVLYDQCVVSKTAYYGIATTTNGCYDQVYGTADTNAFATAVWFTPDNQ